MQNNSEYDQRQLKLMRSSLISFGRKEIPLSSLVGNLEFLLNALEGRDEEWECAFLEEVTTLETVNALAVIKEAGESVLEIENDKKEKLLSVALENLKKIIDHKLSQQDEK